MHDYAISCLGSEMFIRIGWMHSVTESTRQSGGGILLGTFVLLLVFVTNAKLVCDMIIALCPRVRVVPFLRIVDDEPNDYLLVCGYKADLT